MNDKEGAGEWLTPLTKAVKSVDFLVCDIESKDGASQRAGFTRPFLTGVYTGETFHPFYDKTDTRNDWPIEEAYFRPGGNVDRAMRFMLQTRFRGKHIYAHNGGRFDYLFFLPWLANYAGELGYLFDVLPVSSSIQLIDVWTPGSKQKWRFVDSVKLIPMSLDRAAKTFGLSGKLEHDLHIPEWDKRSWNEYNKIDCVQLYGVMTKFHAMIENDLGGEVGITAPSTAMKLFRRKYMTGKIPRSCNTHEFARMGYCGGRVEVFEKEASKLYYYDINSSYPASMKSDMPIGPGVEWEGDPPERFCSEGSGYIGFVDCDVYVPDSLHIPPLPVKCPKTKKLLFPVGNLSGIWEWSEMQLALEVGCKIVKHHQSVWYEGGPLFGDYVDDIYELRRKDRPGWDAGLDAVAKIMLNSLYGKFGMKTVRRRYYYHNDPEMPADAAPATGDTDALIWIAEEQADACYVMPQIAARVTALSRVRLYRGFMAVHKAGGRVAYTDTDSMLATAPIPTSTELGGWKDEFPQYGGLINGRFIAPKVYLLRREEDDIEILEEERWGYTKAKGVSRATMSEVEYLAGGGELIHERLEKVGTLARQADFLRGPRMIRVPRKLSGENTKRRQNSDGTTSPLIMKMF